MEATRRRVCELATKLLGPGRLRMQDEGEYYWIADAGGRTHLGWNLTVAEANLRAMSDATDSPDSDEPSPVAF
jgi:hypothetical protein